MIYMHVAHKHNNRQSGKSKEAMRSDWFSVLSLCIGCIRTASFPHNPPREKTIPVYGILGEYEYIIL